MAGEYGFGGPRGGVIQTAFVVEDLRASIDWWVRDMNAGPFFVFNQWPGDAVARYRGGESHAQITIGMGFVGQMLIELMQPLDDHPSIYREVIETRGYGLHHFGVASDDVDGQIREYEARGYTLAFTAGVPSGGNVAFLERAGNPCFVELIPAGPGMDELFTGFWRASRDWDGSDPVRVLG